MTDYTKLIEEACSTAAKYELENYYGTSKDYTAMCKVEAGEAQRALQSAIEALQGEVERLTTRLKMTSDTMNGYNLQRAALEAKLDELQRQEPVAWTLTEELTKQETTTRAHLWFTDPVNCMWSPLYAAPKALEPDDLTPDERQQVVELLDKEGHDGKDFEPECPLCTARQKLAHGITKGTP